MLGIFPCLFISAYLYSYVWSECLEQNILLGHVFLIYSVNLHLLPDVFKQFPFTEIIDILELRPYSCCCFLFSSFCFSILAFLSSSGFFEHYLEFYFGLSIVFLRVSIWIAFSVGALGITLYIHNSLRSTGINILPVQVKCFLCPFVLTHL